MARYCVWVAGISLVTVGVHIICFYNYIVFRVSSSAKEVLVALGTLLDWCYARRCPAGVVVDFLLTGVVVDFHVALRIFKVWLDVHKYAIRPTKASQLALRPCCMASYCVWVLGILLDRWFLYHFIFNCIVSRFSSFAKFLSQQSEDIARLVLCSGRCPAVIAANFLLQCLKTHLIFSECGLRAGRIYTEMKMSTFRPH